MYAINFGHTCRLLEWYYVVDHIFVTLILCSLIPCSTVTQIIAFIILHRTCVYFCEFRQTCLITQSPNIIMGSAGVCDWLYCMRYLVSSYRAHTLSSVALNLKDLDCKFDIPGNCRPTFEIQLLMMPTWQASTLGPFFFAWYIYSVDDIVPTTDGHNCVTPL